MDLGFLAQYWASENLNHDSCLIALLNSESQPFFFFGSEISHACPAELNAGALDTFARSVCFARPAPQPQAAGSTLRVSLKVKYFYSFYVLS